MAFDYEEGAAVAWTSFAQQPIGRFMVEMRKWHPACSGEHRTLRDAVMDQRIMHDDVIASEQMTDNRHVGRVAADQNDAVFGAVHFGERALERAVNRTLTRYRTA